MNAIQKDNEDKLIKQLLSLWQKYTLLSPNVNSDFFELGGDSLAAINLMVDVQKTFSVGLSLESFMRNPTIPFLVEQITNNNKE